MNAELQPGPDPKAESAQTLGDVLYGADFQQPISETEWIAMIRAIVSGETSAFGNLYMMTHGMVFMLIMRITGGRDAAEDVTLEVFHDVWREARNYDPGAGSVVAWIMNVARARALERRRPAQPERVALVREAVKQLTAEERQVVEATFHGGATSAEVATKRGQTVAAVETHIRAALGKLGEAIAPGGTER